jgi:hypothetical protein
MGLPPAMGKVLFRGTCTTSFSRQAPQLSRSTAPSPLRIGTGRSGYRLLTADLLVFSAAVYESKRNAERFRRDAERPTRRSPFGPHARTEAGDRHAETHHTSADPYQRRTVVRSGSNSLRSPATFSKAFVIATRARQDFRRRRQRELGPQSVGESRRANCRAAGIVPRLSRLAPQHRSDAPHAGQPPEPLSLPSSVPAEPPSSGEHFANWSRCPTFCSGWSWDFSLRRKCARPRKRRCIQAPRGKQTESC